LWLEARFFFSHEDVKNKVKQVYSLSVSIVWTYFCLLFHLAGQSLSAKICGSFLLMDRTVRTAQIISTADGGSRLAAIVSTAGISFPLQFKQIT
jgi:hypothetical protein